VRAFVEFLANAYRRVPWEEGLDGIVGVP